MLTEDLDTFFDVDEFAEQVTLDGVTISAIFSEEPVEVDFVQTKKPVLTCTADDAATVQINSIVVRNGTTYKVKKIERDETARMAQLQLEKQ